MELQKIEEQKVFIENQLKDLDLIESEAFKLDQVQKDKKLEKNNQQKSQTGVISKIISQRLNWMPGIGSDEEQDHQLPQPEKCAEEFEQIT